MDVIDNILSKTCFFILKTDYEKDCVIQEYANGTNGHLLRVSPSGGYNDYFKFIIYPDPGGKENYRMINVGWPNHQVQLESNRAKIVNYQDTDYQRFKFRIAPNPASARYNQEEWYYLHGVGVNMHFGFATHRYVWPTSGNHDKAKMRIIPVDVVQPDRSRIQSSSYTQSELDPPKNYVAVSGTEWGKKVISCEAIPAALITDEDYQNKRDQIALSPYYYLKHEKLWSRDKLPTVTITQYSAKEYEEEFFSEFKSEDYHSIEKTVGHTFDASLEVYAKKKGVTQASIGNMSASEEAEVGATLKLGYQYKNQTVTKNQSSNSKRESIRKKYKNSYPQLKVRRRRYVYPPLGPHRSIYIDQ